jgi:hypothetical protein
VRDVHEQEVRQIRAVGHRVPAARGRSAPRGVVLEEHGRQVAPGASAEPAFGELDLLGSLQDDHVDVGVGQFLGRHLDRGRRPVPGRGTTAAPRAALGQRGEQVTVRALDECRGPGAVDVPDEDVHEGAAPVWGALGMAK